MNRLLPGNCFLTLSDAQGKGAAGCIISLLLIAIVVFAVVTVGPEYYAFKGFETDVRAEISRAGANFYDDDTIRRNIMDLARRNEIKILSDNVKLERFAGQIFVTIKHKITLNFLVYVRDIDMEFKAGSYIGRL